MEGWEDVKELRCIRLLVWRGNEVTCIMYVPEQWVVPRTCEHGCAMNRVCCRPQTLSGYTYPSRSSTCRGCKAHVDELDLRTDLRTDPRESETLRTVYIDIGLLAPTLLRVCMYMYCIHTVQCV